MSINQLHGKKYEDIIKAAFPGSADHGRSINQSFDIEACFDKERQMPTNIKTTKSTIISLADARRFFSVSCDFRLLVGRYLQLDTYKQFYELREYIFTRTPFQRVVGNISLDEIYKFHNRLKSFGAGKAQQILCRKWARSQKLKIEATAQSIIILNPKIDSQNQRRLQCSTDMRRLDMIISPIIYCNFFRDIDICAKIKSSVREFKEKGGE